MKTVNIEGLEKIKAYEFYILCYLDKFCSEYDIEYSLFYGSMLGAIRHDGFIPWDDDIDVAMTWPNYIKFLKLKNKLDDVLNLSNSFEDEENINIDRSALRLKDIAQIDIFPLSKYPGNKLTLSIYRFIIKLLYTIAYGKALYNIENDSFIKKCIKYLIHYLFYFVSIKKISILCNKLINYNENKTRNYMDIGYIGDFSGISFKKEKMEKYSKHKFEKLEFSIYKEYDYILSKTYGDYMKFPPEDERNGHFDQKGKTTIDADYYNKVQHFIERCH